MEGFLTFIFFTIVGIWLLGQIGRLLIRRWILKKQREFAEQFGAGAAGGYNAGAGAGRAKNRREGEVHVQQTDGGGRKVNRSVGEYVEFEEVEMVEETEEKI